MGTSPASSISGDLAPWLEAERGERAFDDSMREGFDWHEHLQEQYGNMPSNAFLRTKGAAEKNHGDDFESISMLVFTIALEERMDQRSIAVLSDQDMMF